jgi:hypothetical protein
MSQLVLYLREESGTFYNSIPTVLLLINLTCQYKKYDPFTDQDGYSRKWFPRTFILSSLWQRPFFSSFISSFLIHHPPGDLKGGGDSVDLDCSQPLYLQEFLEWLIGHSLERAES